MHYLKIIIMTVLLAAALWTFGNRFQNPPEIQEFTATLADIEKQISTPDPLRAADDSPLAFLTRAGTVQWTNAAREENNLSPLEPDVGLNAAALVKVRDMFARQFFAHVSPLGQGASDLADQEGYEYISIGENLALGNFENDQILVEAWMNSPGHRANILGDNFTEIGVAAEQGDFEGRRVWLAVQIFARPRSDCPSVDEFLKIRIEGNETKLDEMQDELSALRQEMEATRPKRGEEYNAKVQAYNERAQEYNALLKETKELIVSYNAQINAFNFCLNE